MAGMDVGCIVKVKIAENWFEMQLSEIFEFLNLNENDLIEIKLSIDKVDGNPIEWLQEKYLNCSYSNISNNGN